MVIRTDLTLKEILYITFVEEERWRMLAKGLGMTLVLAIVSIIVGLILGALIYLWDYSGSKFAKKFFGGFSKILGFMPFSTWLLIVLNVFFLGNTTHAFIVGVVGYSLSYAISVYGALLSSIGSINAGQFDAAFSMGYDKYKALFKVFLPQALPQCIGILQGATVGQVKMTSLASFVALKDLQVMADLIGTQTTYVFIPTILTAIAYTLLAALTNYLVGRVKIKVTIAARSREQIQERVMKGKL